jgi:hypothetical protein
MHTGLAVGTGEGARGVPGETSNEVSGVVHGPSVQARQVSGDVHIHQPAAPPPRLLPPPGPLTDRYAERREMLYAARAIRVIVVTGPRGVGKTALAVSQVHGVRAGLPDGVLLAGLRGFAAGGSATAGGCPAAQECEPGGCFPT